LQRDIKNMTENKIETLLTIAELAKALKLAEQTIRRWVFRREIPFLKIGKAVRFRPSDITKWVDGGGCA
jgi:excisionase family DNA binding protein